MIVVIAIDPNIDPALLDDPAPTPTPTVKSLDTNTSFDYPSPP